MVSLLTLLTDASQMSILTNIDYWAARSKRKLTFHFPFVLRCPPPMISPIKPTKSLHKSIKKTKNNKEKRKHIVLLLCKQK